MYMTFTQLQIWQEGHSHYIRISTKNFSMDIEFVKHIDRNVCDLNFETILSVIVKNLDMDFLRIDIIHCDVSVLYCHNVLFY